MIAFKQWFNSLAKKEQALLLFLAAVLTLYLFFILAYKPLVEQRDRYQTLNATNEQTLLWMHQAVAEIDSLRRGGNTTAAGSNRSLSQLAEMAAGRANIRISRFAPSGDNEAQIWFERIEFEKLLESLSALELDYAVHIESIAINAVNSPGLVNARLKVTR